MDEQLETGTDGGSEPSRAAREATPASRADDGPRLRSRPSSAAAAAAPLRHVLDLNRDWQFYRCDDDAVDGDGGVGDGEIAPERVHDLACANPAEGAAWEGVNLPHAVRLEPVNASGGRNFQGVCWYRRPLHVPREWADRVVVLRFEGAMQVAEVWLNGERVAAHHCGYTPFRVDVTRLVRLGRPDNVLAVRLDNSDDPQVPPGKPQRELDFAYFGGLYRGVSLEATDRLRVTDPILADKVGGGGVFVTYPHVSAAAATVRVRTDVRNDHADDRSATVTQELIDRDGVVVASAAAATLVVRAGDEATFDQLLEVARPKLWHPHHPHLYALRTTAYDGRRPADERVTRVGIRHVRFDRDEGLFINGERFRSIGANRHQDHPYVGYAVPDAAQWRDVRKLREAGFTSFRSHYPQSPAFMDACDELGMLAIVSNPGWQFVGDAVFRQRAVRNARVMVRRDRNRPSVILWEAALNETDNKPVGAALRQAVHEEFAGEPCHTAGDRETGFAWGGVAGWDVDFLHNDGTKPYWVREWGDHVDNWVDQQSANRVARGWGEGPMLVQAAAHLARLEEVLSVGHHGSSSGPDGRRLAGACLWAGIDCQRGYHHQPFYGGVLDAFRLPKLGYYLFASQRPPGVRVPGLDDGPVVFIANFATFLSPTTVTIFSNCEQVRLTHGGREVGVRRPDAGHRVPHPPFTFQVARFAAERSTMYMTGGGGGGGGGAGVAADAPAELRAEGIIGGRVVATHVVRPPGVASAIRVEPDLCGRDLAADGSDWVRVHARVCDARGTVCPWADDLIEFSVDGPGRIIGGPAIGANPFRAEAGIATALVQSTGEPGTVTVRATAFGLTAGHASIVARPHGGGAAAAAIDHDDDDHRARRHRPAPAMAARR